MREPSDQAVGPGALLCNLSDSAYKLIPARFIFFFCSCICNIWPQSACYAPAFPPGRLRGAAPAGTAGGNGSVQLSARDDVHVQGCPPERRWGQTGIFSLTRSSYMSHLHLLLIIFVCCLSSPHLFLHTEPR